MTPVAFFSFVLATFFAVLYFILSSFAQALESLSDVRCRALLEEEPERFGRLLAGSGGTPSRIAARLIAQAAVLGGLFATNSALSALRLPDPLLIAAIGILIGWLLIESAVLRSVSRRGGEALLIGASWLIPFVTFCSAPLTPMLERLTTRRIASPDQEPVTREEKEAAKDVDVRALLDVAREEGILEKHDEELVTRAVDFGDRTVVDVMTPRSDVTLIDASESLGAVADLFVKTKFTRIPIVEGGIDHPVGIVHVKDVFTALRSAQPPLTARAIARPVLFAPESQTIRTLLGDFRRRRQQMAVVVDEYGIVSGLATLEDLVEELVGEIADEHEVGLDPIVPLGEGAWSVAGRVRISEIEHLLDITIPEAGYDTVAGLVSGKLGRIPRPAEASEEAGFLFTVEEADRRRIHRVRIEKKRIEVETEGATT